METHRTTSEDATIQLGRDIAKQLPKQAVVLLIGNLGAGKTTLAKGILEGLGVAELDDVTSPTFTLIQEYRGGRLPLLHVDLYRLDDPREVDDLGLEELGSGTVVAIEWAEKLPDRQAEAISVRIALGEGDTRTIEITR